MTKVTNWDYIKAYIAVTIDIYKYAAPKIIKSFITFMLFFLLVFLSRMAFHYYMKSNKLEYHLKLCQQHHCGDVEDIKKIK